MFEASISYESRLAVLRVTATSWLDGSQEGSTRDRSNADGACPVCYCLVALGTCSVQVIMMPPEAILSSLVEILVPLSPIRDQIWISASQYSLSLGLTSQHRRVMLTDHIQESLALAGRF